MFFLLFKTKFQVAAKSFTNYSRECWKPDITGIILYSGNVVFSCSAFCSKFFLGEVLLLPGFLASWISTPILKFSNSSSYLSPVGVPALPYFLSKWTSQEARLFDWLLFIIFLFQTFCFCNFIFRGSFTLLFNTVKQDYQISVVEEAENSINSAANFDFYLKKTIRSFKVFEKFLIYTTKLSNWVTISKFNWEHDEIVHLFCGR